MRKLAGRKGLAMNPMRVAASDARAVEGDQGPDESPGGAAVAGLAAEPAISRRDLLRGAGSRVASRGVMVGLGGLVAAFAGARQALSAPPTVEHDLDPRALLYRLVQRCSFGVSTWEAQLAESLGYEGYLEYQLKPGSDGMRARLAKFNLLSRTAAQIYSIKKKNFDSGEESRRQLSRAMILRAIYSRKQLVERLVEFFGDHLNVVAEDDKRVLKLVEDRLVIRKHVLGTFPAMLMASAQSPAMMRYLNNDESTAFAPNENYAREVMELHSLGVDGGYTQDDIANLAKILTGWGLYYEWDKEAGKLRGTFRFNPDNHNTDNKTFLGQVIAGQSGAAGIQEGIRAMQILGAHPNTARFLATKLCKKFLADQPRTAWIDAVTATYTQTGGSIPAMMRTLLQPDFLRDARPKLKRPIHLVASAIRALDGRVLSSDSDLECQLERAGQQPFQWHPPNGYPEAPGYWANNPLPRWNFLASLPWGEFKDVLVDINRFFADAVTVNDKMARINQRLFMGLLPANEAQVIRGYLAGAPDESGRLAETVGLALSAPTFQWS